MILLPPCKINLGLRVLRRREDGFHELESCFYPIPMHDLLEAIPVDSIRNVFTISGLEIEGPADTNLVARAIELLSDEYSLPTVRIHLHKQIPLGAGLGGGSSDGSFTLRLLNEMFDLKISPGVLHQYAMRLGSDCGFFLQDKAQMVYGRGEILEPTPLSLVGWYVGIVKPDVHVSTAEAFRMITPTFVPDRLADLLSLPVSSWKGLVTNDFEEPVFARFPQIRQLKEELYRLGAEFAMMSGSGSAVFGLFRQKPCLKEHFRKDFVFEDLLTV